MRSAYCLRGFGTIAPSPLRQHARAYAYRGLPALAPLSMAGSEGFWRYRTDLERAELRRHMEVFYGL